MARKEAPGDEAARGDPLRDGLKHNPFARLRPHGAPNAPAPRPDPAPAPPQPTKSPSDPKWTSGTKPTSPPKSKLDALPSAERIVVRRERKGHGGKAVTIAEGAGLKGHDLTTLAREAAKALGTGARVEDGTLVVQGEQTDRLIAWLTSRGFASLSRGN